MQSGSELWLLKVYHVEYDGSIKSDVQDVFIVSMVENADTGTLEISDETGKQYIANIEKQTVKCL